MFQIFKTPQINFLEKKTRRIAFGFSIILILIGLFILLIRGPRFGIDFAGGFLMEVKFNRDISLAQLRTSLQKINLGDSLIQKLSGKNEFLIRVKKLPGGGEKIGETLSDRIKKILQKDLNPMEDDKVDLNNIHDREELGKKLRELFPEQPDLADQILTYRDSHGGIFGSFKELLAISGVKEEMLEKLKENFYLGSFIIRREEVVGPAIGRTLQWQAILAVVVAMIGILFYIGFRFEFRLAVAADLALLHDILIALGAVLLTGREISIPVIAAFLTLVGYSINDTIVIFDRIRENLKLYRREKYQNLINKSINETLSRTIITSLTTLFVAFSLFLFGGEVLNDFSFILVVGIITGTYSSIYIASAILVEWHQWEEKKKGRR